MAAKIISKAFTFPASTPTGNFDLVTQELDGETPVGVIFLYTSTDSQFDQDTGGTGNASSSIGAYDGTNQTVMWTTHQDGGNISSVFSEQQHSDTAVMLGPGFAVSAASFLPGGVRVNLINAISASRILVAIFFYGSDMDFACGSATFAATTLATGFQAEAVLGWSNSGPLNTRTTGGGIASFNPSFGFAVDDGSLTQYCLACGVDTLGNPVPPLFSRRYTTSFLNQTDFSTGGNVETVDVTAFGATSISVTGGVGGINTGTEAYAWAAFSTGGTKSVYAAVADISQTESSEHAIAGVGFRPDYLFTLPSSHTAAVDVDETADAGLGFGFSDGANEACIGWIASDSAAANSDAACDSRISHNLYHGYTAAAGVNQNVARGYVSEFNDDGFKLAVIANSGVSETWKIPFLAIGQTGPAADVTDDAVVAIGRGTIPTSLGNFDISAAMDGVTPKAAWIFVNRVAEDGNAAGASLMQGFIGSDGTQHAAAYRVKDNDSAGVATTRTHQKRDVCVLVLDPDDADIDAQAVFSSFIPNGVRLTLNVAPGTAYVATAVFFAGASVAASVRPMEFTDNKNSDGACVPFDGADFAIFCGTNGFSENPTTSALSWFWQGYLTRADPQEEVFAQIQALISGGTIFNRVNVVDGSSAVDTNTVGVVTVNKTTRWGARGLAMSRTTATTEDNNSHIAFIVKLPGTAFKAEMFNVSTGTGDQSFTGVGFAPDTIISVFTPTNLLGATADGTNSHAFGNGFYSSRPAQFSQGIGNNNDETTTDSQSYANSTRWVYMGDGAGGFSAELRVKSADADGFTIDKVANTEGAFYVPSLLLGDTLVVAGDGEARGNWL